MDNRHLAIVLFFRAPLGGLQENILATARFAKAEGWRVTVFCPDGPFLRNYIIPSGIEGVSVDFSSDESTQKALTSLCSATVIHAHPGPSRVLALQASQESAAPVFFTIHGRWFDGVQQFAEKLAGIICVSPAVFDEVNRQCPGVTDRIFSVPNGVNCESFPEAPILTSGKHQTVAVVSRLDADKQLVVETVAALWREQAARGLTSPKWIVAGDGTLMHQLILAASELNHGKADPVVEFLGWQPSEKLSSIYAGSDLVLGSGRCAIEALSIGRPSIAIASAGVVSATNPMQFKVAAHSNFGGYGCGPSPSISEILDEVLDVLAKPDPHFSDDACRFVREHHDNSVVNRRLLDLYDASTRFTHHFD